MNALVLYLTAFLASNPLLSHNGASGIQAVSAQYLLGLGKFLALFLSPFDASFEAQELET